MKNINNTQFRELVNKNSEAVIIDCRTESEWDEGRIQNAILLDLFESQLFMQKVEEFNKNKNVFGLLQKWVKKCGSLSNTRICWN